MGWFDPAMTKVRSGPKWASIGFALWDGAARDRGGQKLVSIWHDLDLEPGGATRTDRTNGARR